MKTTLFYVTYAKDFEWIIFSLRSIEKFARGFHEVVIVVPDQDIDALKELVSTLPGTSGIPIRCVHGQEWPGQGFLWHAYIIFMADTICPDSDFIAHLDPDCIFTEPVTPETFIEGGKPFLQYEPFNTIGRRHPGVMNWKTAVENCIEGCCTSEVMRGHPEVYERDLYAHTRNLMKEHTGRELSDYVRSCKNSFPQTIAEFPTLGWVALSRMADRYIPINQGHNLNPDLSRFPVIQFWSHGNINEPQDIWIFGRVKRIIPMDVIKEYGLA